RIENFSSRRTGLLGSTGLCAGGREERGPVRRDHERRRTVALAHRVIAALVTRRDEERKAQCELGAVVRDRVLILDGDLDQLVRSDVGEGGGEDVRPLLVEQ